MQGIAENYARGWSMSKNRSLKKLFLFFLLISVLGGCLFKIGSVDCGISRLSCIEDLQNSDITLNYAWSESDAADLTKDASGNLYGVGSAQVIAVVIPVGNFIQTEGSIGQEVTVEKVLKGEDQVAAGERCYVYKYFGFYPVDGKIEFCDDINLMIPGNKYLIFMDASPLNKYQKEDTFILASENFGYIKIDAEPTKTLDADYGRYQLADLEAYEFFSTSETVTESLNAARRELLESYL